MSVPRPTRVPRVTLGDLAAYLDVASPAGGASLVVTGVTHDSRAVRTGDLYAALPGARVHGADFVAQAVTAGAVAVLTDPEGAGRLRPEEGVPVLVVDDPRGQLGGVAARVVGSAGTPLRMIGITGTNGKTTTAYLVRSALTALGRETGLIGTVETRIGSERVPSVRTTPEAPDLHAILAVMAERGLDSCVMEVSSHALALHRVDGVCFDLALFTNLSQDHLDFHRDLEDYFSTKAELFTDLRARHGLVCVDDAWGRRLAAEAPIDVTTLTSRPDVEADWRITVDGTDPMAFLLAGPQGTVALRSALPGVFNVVNTAMAAVALVLLGEDLRATATAVVADPHVPGRMERVAPTTATDAQQAPLAVVDYAHTPDAVAAALDALRPTTTGALVVVVGAGGDRDRGKRTAMGRAAAERADVVVVTDDNPRSEDPAEIRAAVLAGARAAGSAARVVEVADRHDAIREAVRAAATAGAGSCVAVVGKGHERGQDVGGVVHPFDDRDELRLALDLILKGY